MKDKWQNKIQDLCYKPMNKKTGDFIYYVVTSQ